MEISHPRRILAVSRPDHGLLDLIQSLTGTQPTLTIDTIAGSSHTHTISTAYYTASIPVWLDEIADPPAWSADFLAPEAREVLSVLGAFVVCFKKPVDEAGLEEVKSLLEGVGEVVKEGCGLSWEGVCLAVGMKQSATPYLEKSHEEWEDVCQEYGFEFVDFEAKGRNEYSEPLGMDRLKEALEANDWEGSDELGDAIDLDGLEEDDSDDAASIGFGLGAADKAEMEKEMRGMKMDIYAGSISGGGDDRGDAEEPSDKDVEDLQAMMLKMQAVRDLGADMPEAERKRFAAKAVNDIMKKL
ncbi:uncharacterized protein L3040_004256 [Drepanopeziza brunnea f. sp. 'multigermtubi']|uniref:Alpha and gamma adaptin binding protein p34 n=1 Tax=Marssonina brunnea f. sp. multigermtubi (strain MB_m1) TaxID=1072389 RepID=K1X5P5_MARBU|nr:alpha and gamma adaptin binding protein p34 [Drepanopeziza brunnea f. sp. 'multigermtubi' MB_m1]EKD20456.1 alpha and gamma adaptin binding protein p34 [Drepanopeziza brunnea f. sp. 'multigermtubi' MB_m1]KAJ5042864.1 hypothetical protein L3040_004256 [Drepanopeziza brunnea f. sp. 'multigermtubi']